MSRSGILLSCAVVMSVLFACSVYAGEQDGKENDGLFAAIGLSNLFQPQAAPTKKADEPTAGSPEEKIKLSWGGYGQFMFRYDDNAPETFDVTRMRLRLSGSYDFLSFFAQADTEAAVYDIFSLLVPGGKSESSQTILLDYWVNVACPKYKKELNVRVGRFTVPFGWQTPISPYELLTVNYSQIVSRMFGMDPALRTTPTPWWMPASDWDNLRDEGFYIHGTCQPGEVVGMKPVVGYSAGLLNGESRAIRNTNDNMAGVVRAYVMPKEGITLGASYYDGSRFYSTDPLFLAANGREFSRRIQGIDWKFEFPGHKFEFLRKLLIQGEFIHGETNASDCGKHGSVDTHYKRNHTDGWFVEVGYKLYENLQLVGKLDIMDLPIHTFNTSSGIWVPASSTNRKRTYGLGANYYINKYSKLQVIWEHKDDEGKSDTAGQNDKIFAVFGVNF